MFDEWRGGSIQSATTNSVCWTLPDLAIFEGDRVNRYEIIDGELFVTSAPDWKQTLFQSRMKPSHSRLQQLPTTQFHHNNQPAKVGKIYPKEGMCFHLGAIAYHQRNYQGFKSLLIKRSPTEPLRTLQLVQHQTQLS
uniref:Uncharacterized protein n=1 Tax=Oscillatoriales cyanobacterium SpSt-418 TaxID=2282169 RepID=A0A7C3KJA1_9CYAN